MQQKVLLVCRVAASAKMPEPFPAPFLLNVASPAKFGFVVFFSVSGQTRFRLESLKKLLGSGLGLCPELPPDVPVARMSSSQG